MELKSVRRSTYEKLVLLAGSQLASVPAFYLTLTPKKTKKEMIKKNGKKV